MNTSYRLSVLIVLLVTAMLSLLVSTTPSESLAHRLERGGVLRVGYSIEPPFAYVDGQGRVSGEAPELLRTVMQRMGLARIEWIHVEFGSLIHELESGRIDLIASGLFVTDARRQRVAFSRPTAQVQPALLVQAGNPLALDSLTALARSSARLAVIEGAVEADQALAAGVPEERLLRFRDESSALHAVSTGHCAALALSDVSLRHALRRSGLGRLELVRLKDGIPPGQPAFAVRKSDAALIRRIDHELAAVLAMPEYRQQAERFGFEAGNIAPPAP